jgi:hypothetical protein
MYRGRAAATLAGEAALWSPDRFTECPHEDLREPGRLHVDPFGNLHICQGISIGNLLTPLGEICRSYDPATPHYRTAAGRRTCRAGLPLWAEPGGRLRRRLPSV